MIQEIITYIILIISFGIAIHNSFHFFDVFKSKAPNPCSSCSSGSCALKNELLKKA